MYPRSLAILPSGHPAIAYYEESDRDLKYAWYNGSTWHTEIIDSNGTVGWYASLAILPSGHPAISYYLDYDSAGGHYKDLKYAWYDGSDWHTTTVDSYRDVGKFTSLAILPSGQPAISYSKYLDGHIDELKYAWYDGDAWQITTVDSPGNVGSYTSLAVLPSGQPAISYYDATNSNLKFATPADIAPAPVAMDINYTATAWSELGGTTVVVNGPAYNKGWGYYGETAESSVSLEATDRGHLRGVIALTGTDGEECWEECMEWDPETGECLFWDYWCEPYSCGDANGTVSGTIDIGTSKSYPAGSGLYLDLQVLVGGDSGDAEDYHLQLWRDTTLLGQIDPCTPYGIIIPVLAGETLTFELFASEEDWYSDYEGYERGYEFRIILGMPAAADFNGDGAVNFRDYAMFALHWLEVGCSEPNWCGKADLNKSGDVNWPDLKIFTEHWLEPLNPPPPPPPPACWDSLTQCYGDADGDGFVDFTDLDMFMQVPPGTSYPDPAYDPCVDFNRDGTVNDDDFDILLTWLFESPPADCQIGGVWPPQP